MRNISKMLTVLLIISMFSFLLLTACKKEEEKQIEPISKLSGDIINNEENIASNSGPVTAYKEYANKYDEEAAFTKVEEETGLKSDSLLNEDRAKALYELSDIEIASIKVRSNIEDATNVGTGSEVAIIKLKDTNSNISALTAISKRIAKLTDITGSDKEKYVITPNDGVIVVVINEDARRISNMITEEFYK